MIIEYWRPDTLEEALVLLNRIEPKTIPLGGGGWISHARLEPVAVVDLQNLGLNTLNRTGNRLIMGATATLSSLVEWLEFPEELRDIIKYEYTLNSRNSATLAGVIVRSNHRSSLAAGLLAVDCHLVWEPGGTDISLGDWLPLRSCWEKEKLIRSLHFTFPSYLKFNKISRTPMDHPMLSAVLAKWESGRRRLVIGGICEEPICVFDGVDEGGLVEAALIAHSQCLNINFSEEYLKNMIKTLVNRVISGA